MDIWRIKGGTALEGECAVQGSKNASLPIIAASIVCPARSYLSNVPRLNDVDAAERILRHLGCKAEQSGNDVFIDSTLLSSDSIPHSLMLEMRSSVIFMGALLARCGEARLSLPGGCQLGKRPIDLHLSSLRKMGAEIEENGTELYCRAKKLKGCEINLPFPSVGATENIMLAACRAEGETVIHGAAREPEIKALGEYLSSLGAEISGCGSGIIHIGGMKSTGESTYRICTDRIAAATLCCACACAGGKIRLNNIETSEISTLLHFLKQAGCDIIYSEHDVLISSRGRLHAVEPVFTAPYPGFPTDAQPVLMAALLKAEGCSVMIENIFENRYRQCAELNRLGADIRADGRRAEIHGVETLHGAVLNATDLRGGAAMIIAGLSAEGETTVIDVGHVKRGYESFDACLRSLGADVLIE